jgi:hypothetical protein
MKQRSENFRGRSQCNDCHKHLEVDHRVSGSVPGSGPNQASGHNLFIGQVENKQQLYQTFHQYHNRDNGLHLDLSHNPNHNQPLNHNLYHNLFRNQNRNQSLIHSLYHNLFRNQSLIHNLYHNLSRNPFLNLNLPLNRNPFPNPNPNPNLNHSLNHSLNHNLRSPLDGNIFVAVL